MNMTELHCAHDSSIDELFIQYDNCKNNKNQITNAFLSSLGSHKLLWRSFLPAYAIARTYPKHYFEPNNSLGKWADSQCKICSSPKWVGIKSHDYEFFINQANRSGGIGVYSLEYCIVLLSEFNKIKDEITYPKPEDIRIFNQIITCICHANTNYSFKKNLIKDIINIPQFKSTKYQCQCLFHTLGFCGIMESTQHKGPFNNYVNLNSAPKSSRSSDWEYPVDFWKPSDGINMTAFKYWFGDYPQLKLFWT